MAKQTGLYGIRGKVGEYKYYGMKGVDGTIMAKQNEGMSERVKTAPEYDNTRRNNYEFGMATSTAGAIIKAFSQKWRYLLVPFATAKLAKNLLNSVKSDVGNPWGDRQVSTSTMSVSLAPLMQLFVKNDINDFSPIDLTVSSDTESFTIAVSADDVNNAKAIAAGCDGVRIVLFKSDILPAQGGMTAGVITPAFCNSEELGSVDVDFGDDANLSKTVSPSDGVRLACAVLLPYRTIGTEKYIMQEFCSAKFAQ